MLLCWVLLCWVSSKHLTKCNEAFWFNQPFILRLSKIWILVQGMYYYKTFYGRNCCRIIINKSVCHCYSLSQWLIFAGKARSIPFACSPIRYTTLVCSSFANIRLGWKWMIVASILVHYDTTTIMTIKIFVVHAPVSLGGSRLSRASTSFITQGSCILHISILYF